ncbi:MAG: TRAP transporter TatT component family protein [Proteobacteria bacterium]|nr:TRAP transporter TatT component family protein [Pseudomonadota bacterium]
MRTQPLFALALWLPLLGGCASMVSSATGRLAGSVSSAILNQNDVETVRDGAPAYLLMVDGLIGNDPGSESLLLAGARLYGAYATAFVDDPARVRRLTAKAREYGRRALCLRQSGLCVAAEHPFEEFALQLQELRVADVPVLYGFAASWAGWVQANPDDWSAVADLPKIEAAMTRVVALDEGYDQGGALLYLGVLATLRPESLGGRPEAGRAYFERAVALSHGRNLTAKVLFAKHYARLVFDRTLHDRLLGEVLAADPQAPGLTLANTLAQREARTLLGSADAYF